MIIFRRMHISENGISLCLKAEENWIVYLYNTFSKSLSSNLEHLDPICSWAAVKSAVMIILCKCLCGVLICKCLGVVQLGHMLGLGAFEEISVAVGLVHLPTSGV